MISHTFGILGTAKGTYAMLESYSCQDYIYLTISAVVTMCDIVGVCVLITT